MLPGRILKGSDCISGSRHGSTPRNGAHSNIQPYDLRQGYQTGGFTDKLHRSGAEPQKLIKSQHSS